MRWPRYESDLEQYAELCGWAFGVAMRRAEAKMVNPVQQFNSDADRNELLDTLQEVTAQACLDFNRLDSGGISAYADALRILGREGRVRIISDAGKRVVAERVKR